LHFDEVMVDFDSTKVERVDDLLDIIIMKFHSRNVFINDKTDLVLINGRQQARIIDVRVIIKLHS
jgi:hypothetical protein